MPLSPESPHIPTEREIFATAAALPVEERAAYLDVVCEALPELRRSVEAWFGEHESNAFMQTVVDRNRVSPEQAGERIGRYKLLQEIGEGGFGTVWMAEQMEPVSRRVALKIIKLGMDTREVIARFEQERQALAMMDHPNIAKVHDAGATQSGRPFFVMELVKGVPITQYCDEAGLGTRERLALFGDVCSAINHAHQKGVIHRDIKPSNVMVTLYADKPVVKVIDFGIAKATQSKLTDKTLFTRFEQFIGTPVYMSPEQAAVSAVDIDTRSDIYALGVLLYELLTGKPPFDAKSLASAGYEEMRRIIREVEPPKPSTRVSTMRGEERTTLAKARHIEPDKLHRLVEPDLDWIVMKAIEKDRSRRYETANGFAEDIRRYLANEPVSAAAPSVAYFFRKFARRHRASLGLAALIAVVLVAATGISAWQAKLAITAKKETADALGEVKKGKAEVERQKAEVDRKSAEQSAMLAEAARSDRLVAEEKLRAGLEREAFAHLARACEYDPLSTLASEKAAAALNTWQQHPLPATILAGHKDIVQSVQSAQFSPDGTRIVTASADKTARVWDAATGKSLATLAGHEDRVPSAQFSPDGTRIVTASADKTARVWDAATGKSLATLAGHKDGVVSAQFSPDGTRIVTASGDKTARVWDAATGKSLATLAGHENFVHSAQFSPDGSRIVTASADTARVWDAATGKSLATLAGHENSVHSAQFSPDGTRIVTASFDKTARVWDAATGKSLATLTGHEDIVVSAQFSPDGTRIVTTSFDKTARVWDAAKGKILATLAAHRVHRAQFSPDGTRIVTTSFDKTARIWTILPATAGPPPEWFADFLRYLAQMRLNSDGEFETLKTDDWLALRERMRSVERAGEGQETHYLRILRRFLLPAHATLVAPNAEWKWLHPTDGKDPAGNTPGFHTAFFLPNFDDSAWKTGHDSDDLAGGFGYGKTFAGVDIGMPENEAHRHTAYFRHTFATDKEQTNLELRCQRDDGIIVYLDGKEVLRDNMEAGADAYLLHSAETMGPENDGVVHRFPIPGTLAAGPHTLAISVHNTAKPSSDLRLGGVTLVEVKTSETGK